MACLIQFLCFIFLLSSTVEASGWPSISTMLNNYPSYGSYGNHAIIDAAGLPTWLYGSNTCAIRVSYTLIKSGYVIDIEKGEFNWSRVRASRKGNEKYIIRVNTMRHYLENRKGPADIVSKKQASYDKKKGIIVFQDCPSFTTASGHVDLYDGTTCRGHCYFSDCKDIRLFEFN